MAYVKLAIDKPPSWVRSTTAEVSISSNDLKRRVGTRQFIIIADNDESIDMIACPHLKDISFFAAYFRTFGNGVDPEDRVFLHGVILNPSELPYEIEKDLSVFVIYDDWMFTEFSTMKETTTFITEFMDRMMVKNVNDFVIIMGKKYKDGLLSAVNKSIYRLTQELWRRSDAG